jgi:hypothetical protein
MPIYRFNASRGNDTRPDVRWARLKDERAARHHAKLLIREFVANGRYTDLAQWRLDVKDESGELLLSVPFEDSGGAIATPVQDPHRRNDA